MFEKLISNLGGPKTTGYEIKTELDLADAVKKGFGTVLIGQINKMGLTRTEIEHFIIKKSTLAYRKSHNLPLSTNESEHALRIARILTLADEVFANHEKALTWLRRPNRLFMNRKPLDLLDTEEGARIVENTLGQIAYGLFN